MALGEVRPKMFHVVANLGHRTDGRTGSPNSVALAKRNRRWNTVDAIDLRLVHPVKKLPDIGRECLNVSALSLRKKCVERERTFAGTT